MSNKSELQAFLDEIRGKFPEVGPLMDQHDEIMTTSKMEEFANATSRAFANSDIDTGLSYLNYVNEKLNFASDVEREYIDVYYVEHLFWNLPQRAIDLGWPLVPTKLQKLYMDFHGIEPGKRFGK
ncbi:hypothetical protein ACJJIK_12275 [Microbulbifer sp. ZKSA006]|uniref:DUF7674 family protein n=1 Tax=Microbulbifer sp. ZKSA006 TaxID=3243390 RepID=UPI00403A1B8B